MDCTNLTAWAQRDCLLRKVLTKHDGHCSSEIPVCFLNQNQKKKHFVKLASFGYLSMSTNMDIALSSIYV